MQEEPKKGVFKGDITPEPNPQGLTPDLEPEDLDLDLVKEPGEPVIDERDFDLTDLDQETTPVDHDETETLPAFVTARARQAETTPVVKKSTDRGVILKIPKTLPSEIKEDIKSGAKRIAEGVLEAEELKHWVAPEIIPETEPKKVETNAPSPNAEAASAYFNAAEKQGAAWQGIQTVKNQQEATQALEKHLGGIAEAVKNIAERIEIGTAFNWDGDVFKVTKLPTEGKDRYTLQTDGGRDGDSYHFTLDQIINNVKRGVFELVEEGGKTETHLAATLESVPEKGQAELEKRITDRAVEIETLKRQLDYLRSLVEMMPDEMESIGTGDAYSITDERHPERNEDSVLVDDEHQLYGVFDGMGGHAGGDLASKTAMEYLALHAGELSNEMPPKSAQAALIEIIEDANQKVIELGQKFTGTSKPGTTAAIVKLISWEGKKYAVVANVGDSRVYFQNNENIHCVTEDDNGLSHDMTRQISEVTLLGDLDARAMEAFRTRNQITNSLGSRDMEIEDRVQIYEIYPNSDKKIIITSDGIHDNLTSQDIRDVLTGPNGTAKGLAERASARSHEGVLRSKPDDMSCVIINLNLQ